MRSMTVYKSAEDAKKALTKWFNDEAVLREEKDSDKHQFNLGVEYPSGSGRLLNVVQGRDDEDSITILSGFSFDWSQADALGDEEKTDLLRELRFGLLKMKGNYNLNIEDGELKGVTLSDTIYYDGLTKDRVMNALDNNWKRFLFTTWTLQDRLGAKTK